MKSTGGLPSYNLVDKPPHGPHARLLVDVISNSPPRIRSHTALKSNQFIPGVPVPLYVILSRVPLKDDAQRHRCPLRLKNMVIKGPGVGVGSTGLLDMWLGNIVVVKGMC